MDNKKNITELLSVFKKPKKYVPDAKMCNFVNDFASGKIEDSPEGMTRVKDFLQRIITNHPRLGISKNAPEVIIIEDSNDKTTGMPKAMEYDVVDHKIKVPKSYIKDIINGKVQLSRIIESIAHEGRHAVQKAIVNPTPPAGSKLTSKDYVVPKHLTEEERKKIESVKKDMLLTQKLRITKDDYLRVIYMLRTAGVNNRFIKLVEKTPIEMQNELCKQIVYGQYISMKHEEDARMFGLEIAKEFFEGLKGSKKIDISNATFLDQQSAHVEKMIQEEKQENQKERYSFTNQYTSLLSNMTAEEFDEIEKSNLGTFRNSTNEKIHNRETLLSFLTQSIVSDKSILELLEIFYSSLYLNNSTLGNESIKAIVKNEKLTDDTIEQFQSAMINILSKADLNSGVFENFHFSLIMKDEQISSLISSQLKEGKVVFADSLLKHSMFIHGGKDTFSLDLFNSTKMNYDESNSYSLKNQWVHASLNDLLSSAEVIMKKIDSRSQDVWWRDYNAIYSMVSNCYQVALDGPDKNRLKDCLEQLGERRFAIEEISKTQSAEHVRELVIKKYGKKYCQELDQAQYFSLNYKAQSQQSAQQPNEGGPAME